MNKWVINVLGWTGSAGIVAAYALNSYQVIQSESILYLLLNLVGGVLLIIYSYYYRAYANTFINVVWVIIAAIAIASRL